MNTKFLTIFVLIAVILAAVVYFGGIYEGFEDGSSNGSTNGDQIIPGSSAPPVRGAYNHFTKQSEETLSGTFYAQNPEEGSIEIISQDAMILHLPSGQSITLEKKQENQEGFTTAAYGTFVVYKASNGASATIVHGKDGMVVIRLQKANGQVVYYTKNGVPSADSTSTDSSTGTTTTATPTTTTESYSVDTTPAPVTNSQPSTSTSYSSYPAQTTYNTYSPPTDYTSALPAGIPKYLIPPGQEDMYILKTEVIPPICPAPRQVTIYKNNSDCPKCKCPAPQPCPEDPFECKKVPNYNAVNNMTLPVPVLSDFSTFGM